MIECRWAKNSYLQMMLPKYFMEFFLIANSNFPNLEKKVLFYVSNGNSITILLPHERYFDKFFVPRVSKIPLEEKKVGSQITSAATTHFKLDEIKSLTLVKQVFSKLLKKKVEKYCLMIQ